MARGQALLWPLLTLQILSDLRKHFVWIWANFCDGICAFVKSAIF